jgi:hypothetical protein
MNAIFTKNQTVKKKNIVEGRRQVKKRKELWD